MTPSNHQVAKVALNTPKRMPMQGFGLILTSGGAIAALAADFGIFLSSYPIMINYAGHRCGLLSVIGRGWCTPRIQFYSSSSSPSLGITLLLPDIVTAPWVSLSISFDCCIEYLPTWIVVCRAKDVHSLIIWCLVHTGAPSPVARQPRPPIRLFVA